MYDHQEIYNLIDLDYNDAKLIANFIKKSNLTKDKIEIIKNGILGALKDNIENYTNPEVYNVILDFMYKNKQNNNAFDQFLKSFNEYPIFFTNKYENPAIVREVLNLYNGNNVETYDINSMYFIDKINENDFNIINLIKNNHEHIYMIKYDGYKKNIIRGIELVNDLNNQKFIGIESFENIFLLSYSSQMSEILYMDNFINNIESEKAYLSILKKYAKTNVNNSCKIEDINNAIKSIIAQPLLTNHKLTIETFERLNKKIDFQINEDNENGMDIHNTNHILMNHIVNNYNPSKKQVEDIVEIFVHSFFYEIKNFSKNEKKNIINLIESLCFKNHNDILMQTLIDCDSLKHIIELDNDWDGNILFEQKYTNMEHIKALLKITESNYFQNFELPKYLFLNNIDFIKEQLKMDYEKNKEMIILIKNNPAFNNLNLSEKEIYNDFIKNAQPKVSKKLNKRNI